LFLRRSAPAKTKAISWPMLTISAGQHGFGASSSAGFCGRTGCAHSPAGSGIHGSWIADS
jgi:hypothetical protein